VLTGFTLPRAVLLLLGGVLASLDVRHALVPSAAVIAVAGFALVREPVGVAERRTVT
jgi:hypothetical protein